MVWVLGVVLFLEHLVLVLEHRVLTMPVACEVFPSPTPNNPSHSGSRLFLPLLSLLGSIEGFHDSHTWDNSFQIENGCSILHGFPMLCHILRCKCQLGSQHRKRVK